MNLNGHSAPQEAPKQAYTLLKADREAVVKFWPVLIRPGLERIKAKDKRSGYWQPEHVRQRIEAGFAGQIICECLLILQVNKAEPVGFLVTQVFNDEFLGTPLYLHLWLVWCEGAPAWRVMRHIQPQVEKRAVELGLRGIQGLSSRLAWMRRLGLLGYSIHQVIIRKDLV
jgi:hypothetical protein